jgi:hypothetical protein
MNECAFKAMACSTSLSGADCVLNRGEICCCCLATLKEEVSDGKKIVRRQRNRGVRGVYVSTTAP